MEEYVSLQTVLDIASQYCPDDDGSCSKADVDLREMLDEIEALPTTDVQPVKHGRWFHINNGGIIYCSECENEAYWDTDYGQQLFDYCPYCGARMIKDGDKE
jgi:hypothetical protein